MYGMSRRRFLAGVGAGAGASLAGCIDSLAGDGSPRGPDDNPSSNDDDGVSAGETSLPTVDRSLPEDYTIDELNDEVRRGGPPPDGIPSIDDPEFVPAADAPSLLDDGSPVFGVEMNGEAKAYPQYILVWHEIVNDVIGGESVAVTYCPLTGTAQGFYRGDVEFGVSGRLINSNLVMFDRESDSWWPQILALSIRDPHTGSYLEEFQVVWTTWEHWRREHPESEVLTENTGSARNYGNDPYGSYDPAGGYYSNDNTLFSPLATDDRFPKKTVVIGARSPDGAMAVPKDVLRDESVIDGSVGDVPYVTVYDPALDTGYVYRNPDERTVEYDDGRAVVDGEAYDPDSLPLDREIGFDAMWFAWYGYYPSTVVHE